MLPLSQTVTIIKNEGTAEERRLNGVRAEIQPKVGFFDLHADIDAGDVVESHDPRPGRGPMRQTVATVEVYSGGLAHGLEHIEVTWGPPPAPSRSAPKPLALGDLHELVVDAAAALYRDGHYSQAVFEAFKAVERRVRDMTGIQLTGTKLMGAAFQGDNPKYSLTKRAGVVGRDEQEGRALILTGSVKAIRNPGGHEQDTMEQPAALELLALASQMMRWLDDSLRIL